MCFISSSHQSVSAHMHTTSASGSLSAAGMTTDSSATGAGKVSASAVATVSAGSGTSAGGCSRSTRTGRRMVRTGCLSDTARCGGRLVVAGMRVDGDIAFTC